MKSRTMMLSLVGLLAGAATAQLAVASSSGASLHRNTMAERASAPLDGLRSTEDPGPAPALAKPPDRVQTVLSVYETLRGQLARDEIASALTTASALERAAKEASTKSPKRLQRSLQGVASSAQRLSQTAKADSAAVRRAFGDVSKSVVALIDAEPALRQGRYIFECAMAQGYKKWVQTREEISNPYMGKKMPGCGSKSQWDER